MIVDNLLNLIPKNQKENYYVYTLKFYNYKYLLINVLIKYNSEFICKKVLTIKTYCHDKRKRC